MGGRDVSRGAGVKHPGKDKLRNAFLNLPGIRTRQNSNKVGLFTGHRRFNRYMFNLKLAEEAILPLLPAGKGNC